MKGFYVYCIRPQLTPALALSVKGVEFAKSIKVFSFKDVEAIVGELDTAKFDGAKLKNKLLDDPKWTAENIRRHHEVIDQAFQTSVIIPMKFGRMFKTEKSLMAMLARYYPKFKNVISRLHNKKEWGVKVYLEQNKFVIGLKKNNKEIQMLEKRRSSAPEGMKWYIDRKIDEIITAKSEGEIERENQLLVENLAKQVEKLRLNDALSKDIQESARVMIMNAACLVKNDALQEFKNLFQELAKEAKPRGVMLELTGPWPPYNFVDFKNEKA